MDNNQITNNLKYLELLSKQFSTVHDACTEIINLEAILNLPKGTEHFLSDVHGEDEAFMHLIKSGSGIVRSKVDYAFGSTITNHEKKKLAILIYYPKETLQKLKNEVVFSEDEWNDWFEVTLHRLVLVLREVSTKYTRSKVRKALPEEFEYIIEELLHHRENLPDKDHYYSQIIKTIIEIGRAKAFIIAISEVIQRLAVDHLHIIGDIYDRGPNPDKIIEKLMKHHSVDIQWGNHDIVWMGAAAGVEVCILNIIRICARYGSLDILEENYGINILPIAKYAMKYCSEPEKQFYPKNKEKVLDDEAKLSAQINKAATLMQFKMEEIVIDRNKTYHMEDRKLMSKIDVKSMTVTIDGTCYPLMVNSLPNVDEKNPAKLSEEELVVISKLKASFLNNSLLQAHVDFLFEKGGIYKVYNGNLLFHGCIPMNEDGSYTEVTIKNKEYKGRALLDKYEKILRKAHNKRYENTTNQEMDVFWYLWTGPNSSLFGKDTMRTFERIFIEDKATHVENKNPYYRQIEKEAVCKQVLEEFGLSPEKGHIINGHVPVKVNKGESPVKAGGRLIVIDGGLSKAYQNVTGIAGYTLLFNSYGMLLASHEPFTSAKDSYENNVDMISELSIVEITKDRILVADTDIGKKLADDIADLKLLLAAYRQGDIKTQAY